MKRKSICKTTGFAMLLALFLLSLSCFVVGDAYARYQKKISEQMMFEVKPASQLKITGLDDKIFEEESWEKQEDGSWQFSFRVHNQEDEEPNAYATYFRMRILASLGMYLDDAKLSLIVEETNEKQRVYEGVAEPLAEDSLAYQEFGPGIEYRFYDLDEKELQFELAGGTVSEQKFIVRIEGVKTTSLLEFDIKEVPAE